MRILQIHTRYRSPGGEDSVVASEAAVLTANGHEVIEWQAANSADTARAAAQLAWATWNPLSYTRIRMLIRQYRPDVVHVHNTWFALSQSVLAGVRAERCPLVATLHNYRPVCANGLLFRDGHICEDCVGASPMAGVRNRCYRGSYAQSAAATAANVIAIAQHRHARDVDRLVVLTNFARSLLTRAGMPADKLYVKPNFVANPGIRPLPPSASRRVLFVGRMTQEKGIQMLLDAWSRTEPAGLVLTLVGEGPLRDLAARTKTKSVEMRPWLGSRELAQLLMESRALLIPSLWYEGQPRIALEAMAAGLPILGSALGGLGELLDGTRSECAIPPDLAGWVSILPRLRDDAWLDNLGSTYRSRYLEDFDERAGLSGLESLYGQLTHTARR